MVVMEICWKRSLSCWKLSSSFVLYSRTSSDLFVYLLSLSKLFDDGEDCRRGWFPLCGHGPGFRTKMPSPEKFSLDKMIATVYSDKPIEIRMITCLILYSGSKRQEILEAVCNECNERKSGGSWQSRLVKMIWWGAALPLDLIGRNGPLSTHLFNFN